MKDERRRELILLYKTWSTDKLKKAIMDKRCMYRPSILPLIKDELLRRNVIIPENELPSGQKLN